MKLATPLELKIGEQDYRFLDLQWHEAQSDTSKTGFTTSIVFCAIRRSPEALPMTESIRKRIQRPITRIFRTGQALEIEPLLGALQHTLRTRAHVAAPVADHTLKVFAPPLPLYHETEVIGEPGLVCWAGWEPVIHRLLRAEGYDVETIGSPRRPLPLPDMSRLHRLDFVDHALLDCVHQQERSLVRYAADHVDPVHLVAQIALAWPKQRIAVIATRIDEGRHMRDRLRGYGICAVAVNSENVPPEVGAVAVCTPVGLSHLPVQVEWLDIVIVLDAQEIATKVGIECIGHRERARLLSVGPGQRTVTVIPVPANSFARACDHEFT
jgi:hypothetical protein